MPQGINKTNRSAVFTDLGLVEYSRALEMQHEILREKINLPRSEDQILFVEHPCVFTLGRRGGQENLIVSRDFLRSKNIDLVQTGRGGDITFHGPGQAVLYPIVDLGKNRIGVKDFVFGLEEVMKRTAVNFKVDADRNTKNHGIWVKESKLGSVGISIKKGISIHGIAMNIHPDLEPFSWIHPCGLANVSMTSIEKELAASASHFDLSMARVKDAFLTHFSSIFNYSIVKKNEI